MKTVIRLALCFAALSTGLALPAQSPYSVNIFRSTAITATSTTTAAIPLGTVATTPKGGSYSGGKIQLTGVALTTATFGVTASSDNGVTYSAVPICTVAATPVCATTQTATASTFYNVDLTGITHIKYVTSGTFTATSISLVLTAAPNSQSAKSSGGGTPGGAAGGDLSGTYPNPTVTGAHINAGTIDTATIGATTPGPITGSTVTSAGDVVLSGAAGVVMRWGAVKFISTSLFGGNTIIWGENTSGVNYWPHGLSVGTLTAPLNNTGVIATNYSTATNCASAASPAACGSAAAGAFVIAAAATTAQVNTTAVTTNSRIIVTPDETLGTVLGVTCNATAATALAGVGTTARVVATSFTVTTLATIAANPACYSYLIIN